MLALWSCLFYSSIYFVNVRRLTLMGINKYVARNLTSYLNSFLNALTVSLFSIYCLYDLRNESLFDLYTLHSNTNILLLWMTGYFVQDIFHLLFKTKSIIDSFVYIFHHLLSLTLIYYVLSRNILHGSVLYCFLIEIPTVLADSIKYFNYYKKYYKHLYETTNNICYRRISSSIDRLSYFILILFACTFFVFRIVFLLIFFYNSYLILYMYNPYLLSYPIIMISLNCYWFKSIMYILFNYRFLYK